MKEEIILIVIVVVFLIVGGIGLKVQERSECLQWEAQAEQYSDYYITKWQKDQCDNYKVEIKAPIK